MEPTQEVLLEMPEQPGPVAPPAGPAAASVAAPPKLKPIDRAQGLLRAVIVEELVAPDHKVRAIWDLTGQLNLSGFLQGIRSREGKAGSPAWDPRLLLSVWLYAYSEQVSSAREIARLMEYEPGLMWLSGLGEVNYHTLADFRAAHKKELKRLLAELLGVLSKEGIVKLELVAHDGTKIRAQAGADTFRREKTLEKETARARQLIEELEREVPSEGTSKTRREAARERTARELLERMQQAAEELGKVREGKAGAKEMEQARVSLTEPEARIMKHGDGGLAPSYNVQLSTDAAHKVIVGVELTQSASDSGSLAPAMDEVRNMAGRYPEAAVADGGFTNQESIAKMEARGVPFYGSLSTVEARQAGAMKAAGIDPAFGPSAFTHDAERRTLQCPAGKSLVYLRQSKKRGETYHQFEAASSDCEACLHRNRCCPPRTAARLISIRVSENAEVAAFRAKMETPEAKQIYRQRGPTAEFPNAWIKEKLGIRKFRLRGLAKATTEALWAVLTYDVMQWLRLSWRPKLAKIEYFTARA
jgi:transposase